jgi:hypothetical protein
MGAEVFFTRARGNTAKEAFQAATEEARYEHGHGGYSGTIAEKHSFKVIPFSGADGISSGEYADLLIERCDSRVDDKWGPAGCIQVPDSEPEDKYDYYVGEGANRYLFFGWASS